MSLTILPNQALAAANAAPFKCNTRYFLPSMRGDNFTLQGFSTVLGSTTNLVNFNNFTLGTGWSVGGGLLNYSGNTSITSATSAALGLQVNGLYLLFVQVTVTNLNNATNGQGFNMTFNGNHLSVPDNLSGTAGYNDGFTLLQYYSPTSIVDDKIVVSTNYPGIQFNVNISMLTCSVPVIAAYDLDDNFVSLITPNYTHYFGAPVFNVSLLNAAPCRFETQFNLNALNDSCYSLCINDGSGYVLNGYFNNSTGWSTGPNWSISNNAACYVTSAADSSQVLVTNINVIAGLSSTLSFNVTGLDNAAPYERGLKVSLQFNSGSPLTQTYVSNGLQTFSFTVPNGATGQAILTFAPDNFYGGSTFPPPPVSANMCISNVQTQATGWQSNNITFRTEFAEFETHLFTATNNDGAFNFDYSNGLTHSIRLWSKMKYKEYKQEVEEYNFSDNSNVLMTSSVEKIYEIIIGDAAEFVHDCLSMMMINDNFAVDGAAYIRNSSYSLKMRKSTELSPATFDIKPVQGISKNWNVN